MVEKTSVSGIVPELTVKDDSAYPRSEAAVGALVPWADRLWMTTYVTPVPYEREFDAVPQLYEIDDNFNMTSHQETTLGSFHNRMVHSPSDQLIIGPHAIDAKGEVRTFEGFTTKGTGGMTANRLTATMEHLEDPENMVYFLTMDGLFYEADVHSRDVELLYNLVDVLGVEGGHPVAHFKGGHTGHGRVVVANNSYDEAEFNRERSAGKLVEWDGDEWTTLENNPFMEVAGRRHGHSFQYAGTPMFASGWDNASCLLKIYTPDKEWTTYRLPKATRAFDHMWATEWTRIRAVEHDRYMMDLHGMFYELAGFSYNGNVLEISPVCKHLRIIPDYCSFAGMFVMGGDQVTPSGRGTKRQDPEGEEDYQVYKAGDDSNLTAGQPQSGLWFGKTDDLWQFGKPTGWGGPWWETSVEADEPSDPYLIHGFDEKVLHISHEADSDTSFTLQVDFKGDLSWNDYDVVNTGNNGYTTYDFPSSFDAQWIRIIPEDSCNVTAIFNYS